MPISSMALEGLRTLRPKANIDPNFGEINPNEELSSQDLIAGRIAQEDQLEQMQKNLYNEAHSGGKFVTGATPAAIHGLQGALNEDPDFGEAAQARSAARNQSYDQAMAQGFRGPDPTAQRAEYGRKQEATKLGMPLQVAQATGQADIERQKIASQGQLNVAQEQNKGYENLQQLLGGTGAGGGVSHVNLPHGGGGVTFNKQPQSKISPQTWSQLATARGAVGEGSGNKWLGFGGPSNAKVKLDALVQSAFAQHPASDDVKNFAHDVVSNPATAKLPFSQIAPRLKDEAGAPMSPQELDDLRDLVGVLRGSDF